MLIFFLHFKNCQPNIRAGMRGIWWGDRNFLYKKFIIGNTLVKKL